MRVYCVRRKGCVPCQRIYGGFVQAQLRLLEYCSFVADDVSNWEVVPAELNILEEEVSK